MKTMITWTLTGLLTLGLCGSCKKEPLQYKSGDVQVTVEQGENWLHDFPLFMGIKRKNAPQIAIWLEDASGKYLSTVYVSHRVATESWIGSGGNRRKEALPCWGYARGVQYSDGLYLPTKKEPLADAISGATPRGSFDVKMTPASAIPDAVRQFTVKVEVNHSTDFNDYYPKMAKEGELGWSGGEMGSGQPALVYAAFVDLDSGKTEYEATLTGHSTPDGSGGAINPDLSTLTTALGIVKRIVIRIR